MSTFIERNPKERAVEQAFQELAKNDYVSNKPDPADDVFKVAEKLKRQVTQGSEANKTATLPNDI